jgi:hypothetical protein
MSNLWFNIRFGKYHWQLSNTWQVSFKYNTYWDHRPQEYVEASWFEIYCAFGRHL